MFGLIYLLKLGLGPFACWTLTWTHLFVVLKFGPICLLGLSLDFDTFS